MFKGLHVFDLDHTLLTTNSSYCFGWYLYRQGFFPFSSLIYCIAAYALHKGLGLSLQKLHQHTFAALFKGRSLQDLQTHVECFLAQQGDKWLYTPACERLAAAKASGAYTVISSSSPDFLVAALAKKFAVDAYFATTYLPNHAGKLERIGMVKSGKEKADDIIALAQQLQLPLASLTSYSDSHLDIPLLEISGAAVAVNPDWILRKTSVQLGWEII